ncbi:MAG: GNAT family N-acetyltransferase [Anaerolineae bacterium]
MKILTASILDLLALSQLETLCFPKDRWPLWDLVAVLTFPQVIRLKALEGGKMVGFVAGDPRPEAGFSWIATLSVHPDYQRRGIGRALLRACERQLFTPQVRLIVRASNLPAIALYESEGYRFRLRKFGYYSDGEDGLEMEKKFER